METVYDQWIHVYDVKATVALRIDRMLLDKSHNPEAVEITVRWPNAEEAKLIGPTADKNMRVVIREDRK